MLPTKEQAWDLLCEYNEGEFHRLHARIVGDVMRYFAVELGYADEADFWQTVGILHDLDFEQYPDQHCTKEAEILREKGVDERLVHAVVSHGYLLTVDGANHPESFARGAQALNDALAAALGLTLADLMHCRDPQEADIAPEVPLEDFFTLLCRQQSIDWRSVRAVLFWLSAALAIWGILACPGRMAVHWRTLSNGNLQADGWLASWVFFPLFVGIEFLSLELWNNFEQTGYYRHWGEIGASVTRSMNFCSPAVRLWKFVLDLLFFFGFGFAIPCAEMMAILIN